MRIFLRHSVLGACLLISLRAQRPTGYVDPQSCALCHAEIAANYAQTPMARSFGSIGTEVEAPLLSAFTHQGSRQIFRLEKRNQETWLERRESDGDNLLSRRLDYFIGSGNHARSYLSRTKAGELVESPVSWYSEDGGFWAMSPAYDTPQHAGFSRRITYRCFFCHSAYPEVPAFANRWDNSTHFPATLPSGIDCQRCHGPGEAHVAAGRRGSSMEELRAAIVNPAKLPAKRRDEVCLQCHLETTNLPLPGFLKQPHRGVFSYVPGQALEEYILHFDQVPSPLTAERFEFAGAPYRLRQSACYLRSEGRLTCTTCHRAHNVTTKRQHDQACQSCHPQFSQGKSNQRHPATEDCASCHMPRGRADDAIHVTTLDHRIVRKPDALVRPRPLSERNASNTAPYRGAVRLYYPEKLSDPAQQDLWLAAAQVANQSNLANGVALLESAIERHRPRSAYFYVELASAYRASGRSPASLYRQALALDSDHLGALLGSGELPQLRRALQFAPGHVEATRALASKLLTLGIRDGAIELLRSALNSDPDAHDLHNTLGLALLASSDLSAAERSFREAVRLRPELPPLRANLATLLSRQKNFSAATKEFEQALFLGPRPEIHSAYGLALSGEGRFLEARKQFEAAIALNPKLPNTHNNLGFILERLGERDLAAAHYREATRLEPNFALANLNLGKLTASRELLESALRLARMQNDRALARDAEAALRALSTQPR